ncbi:hypothetical protein [Scardovia inopinata]|uniref:hypothetical protein n=1 Tax=Scardovia inopinata TaxID=78259 RepID=UPI0001D0A1F9|nr:hypothetical protein [Scardovia inopinata]BAR06608.1 hypothetical protein SCIP_0541 [Scardovia inopinata JCM 12537]
METQNGERLRTAVTYRQRHDFIVFTVVMFIVGAFTYLPLGIWSACTAENHNPAGVIIGVFFSGGYLLFSILTGLIITTRWVSTLSYRSKIIIIVFFLVPLIMVMAGIYYSIPYWFYNLNQYRRMKKERSMKCGFRSEVFQGNDSSGNSSAEGTDKDKPQESGQTKEG